MGVNILVSVVRFYPWRHTPLAPTHRRRTLACATLMSHERRHAYIPRLDRSLDESGLIYEVTTIRAKQLEAKILNLIVNLARQILFRISECRTTPGATKGFRNQLLGRRVAANHFVQIHIPNPITAISNHNIHHGANFAPEFIDILIQHRDTWTRYSYSFIFS